jgi:hypothetical protein
MSYEEKRKVFMRFVKNHLWTIYSLETLRHEINEMVCLSKRDKITKKDMEQLVKNQSRFRCFKNHGDYGVLYMIFIDWKRKKDG